MNVKFLNDKIYFLFFLLLALFGVFYYVILTNKTSVEIYLSHNDKINQLLQKDETLNIFIVDKSHFILFDDINNNINGFHNTVEELIEEAKFLDFRSDYIQLLKKISKTFEEKELWVERYKARKSFEFNIKTFVLDRTNTAFLSLDEETIKKINNMRFDLLVNIELENFNLVDLVAQSDIDKSNKYIQNLIKQMKALENSMQFQKKYQKEAINPNLKQMLLEVKNILEDERKNTKEMVFLTLNSLFILIFVSILALIVFYRKLTITKDQLGAFRKAVENSDNVVVMTDKQSNIIYANEAFEKVAGYSKDQAIGKNPRILKSGLQDDGFYKELNETIHSGRTWRGQFINKNKNGELFYENASISPIYADDEIVGYLAIKLDVTQAVKQANELNELNRSLQQKVDQAIQDLRDKDKVLFEQAKMAALGEMIANIAHQWRQPLTVISSAASALNLQKQLNILDDAYLFKTCQTINDQTQYLSKTIDDFRNFIAGKSQKDHFNVKESIDSFLNIVSNAIKQNEINIKYDIDPNIEIYGLKNELNQCLMNLFNNAKDALLDKEYEKHIILNVQKDEKDLVITFLDNAGGIPEDIIEKIFEPYFTTKHQTQGTGLGLNMTYRLIVEAMGGTITVKNKTFEIQDKNYTGAKFTITLPLN